MQFLFGQFKEESLQQEVSISLPKGSLFQTEQDKSMVYDILAVYGTNKYR